MFYSTFCKRFFLKTSLVSLLSLTSLFGTEPSAAAILNNGGFENGFEGWEPLGRTSIRTTAYYAPSEGMYLALLDTFSEQTGNRVELAKFLNVGVSDLNNLISGEVFEGSAIKMTLTAEAGTVLSFDWNFLTDSFEGDYLNLYNDFAFVTISENVNKLSDTFSVLIESLTDFEYETGFQTFSYTLPSAGTYTLGIGVVDVGDGAFDSGLLVDNVVLSSPDAEASVPESTSVFGLLVFGALSVGWRLFRQRS